MNQCDGCRAKLLKDQYGLHLTSTGWPYMACTAKLYPEDHRLESVARTLYDEDYGSPHHKSWQDADYKLRDDYYKIAAELINSVDALATKIDQEVMQSLLDSRYGGEE